MPDGPQNEDSRRALLSENDLLRAETLSLRKAAELDEQFRKHVKDVEDRLRVGKYGLGAAGLLVLLAGWFATYEKFVQHLEPRVEKRVEKRLDEEFSNEKIRALISHAATDAAHKEISQRLTLFGNTESEEEKCLINRLGRDLFLLQCRTDGSDFDLARGVCISHNGGEERSYENAFPKANCDKASETSAPHSP